MDHNRMNRYHFYKCSDPKFAQGYDFFDHAKGIVGFRKKQDRERYIGVGTIEDLSELYHGKPSKASNHKFYGGRKRGVPNA